MPPPLAPTIVYATQADISALLSPDGLTGRVDDSASGTPSADELLYIDRAINYATSRVNFYCLGTYDAADLAQVWMVNEWCVICAAHWLSTRRGNPAPGSYDDLYKQAIEDMKLVQKGEAQLPEIGLRTAAWPAWSNVRTDIFYSLRKIRVERPISERTPQQAPFRQNRDIVSDFLIEPN